MIRLAARSFSFATVGALALAGTWACSSSSSSDGSSVAGSSSSAAGTHSAAAGTSSGGGSAAHGGASGSAGSASTAGSSSVAGNNGSAGASAQGGNASGGATSNGGSTGTAGSASAGMSNTGSGGTGAGGAGVTWSKVFVTWYGYDDNSCDTEAQHTCNNIAYPMSDGFPTKHNSATEGKGTYDDPITFAAATSDNPESFGGATLKPGSIIYYAKVKKYFMLEDSCFECSQQWQATKLLHVDLWMGPSMPPTGQTMFGQPLIDCENNSTDSSADNPTDTIIVDPPSNLEVSQTVLFDGTNCNVP